MALLTGHFRVFAFQRKPAVSGMVERQRRARPTGLRVATQTVLRPLVPVRIGVAAYAAFVVEANVVHAVARVRGFVRSVTRLARNPLVGALQREVGLIVVERVRIKVDQRRIPASVFAVTAPAGARKRAVET